MGQINKNIRASEETLIKFNEMFSSSNANSQGEFLKILLDNYQVVLKNKTLFKFQISAEIEGKTEVENLYESSSSDAIKRFLIRHPEAENLSCTKFIPKK